MNLYPWLQSAVERLQGARAAGRLPPALLIHAPSGIGADLLPVHFAQLRFCTASAPPCGNCQQCRRVAAGEHPDFSIVGPDPESKLGQISVDQVRELSRQLALSSHDGHGSVVVLDPAEALNRHAANALLKTLEEPRPDAHLILLAAVPSQLPATIRSRCQKLSVTAPDRDAALAWLRQQEPSHASDWPAVLELLGIAPLEALAADVPRLLAIRQDIHRLLGDALQGRIDVIRTAEAWAKDELPLRLRGLENCLRARLLAAGEGHRSPPVLAAMDLPRALRLLEQLRELQRQLAGAALNRPLALERQLWSLNSAAPGQSR